MFSKESTSTLDWFARPGLRGHPETSSRLQSKLVVVDSETSTTLVARPSNDSPTPPAIFINIPELPPCESVGEVENRVSIDPMKIPHRIAGEPFYFEFDHGQVFLRHELWSLLGSGSSLIDAEMDLKEEARQLADVWFDLPVESLDYEAFRLRDFLYRII